MIYVDTTSTCKTGMNTGVARMVRGIWNCLSHCDLQAMVWEESLHRFCRASSSEKKSLQNISQFKTVPKWRRFLRHRLRQFKLENKVGPGSCVFVPEIFQDGRVDYYQALARTRRVAMVAVFHDAIAWKHAEWTAIERRPRFDSYMAALSKFQRVICVSQEAAADLKKFWEQRGLVGGQISVHSWPTDFPGGRPSTFNSTPGTLGTERRVLCVSSLEQRKNHLRLLEAAEKLWNEGVEFTLELIGGTCPDWGGRVIRRVKDLKDAGHSIEWSGGVDENQLHLAYARSSFTVYPSLCEGYGLPIVESLWHGRPCLCGSNGALAEAASGGGCVTIDMMNVENITSGIRGLLIDPQLYASLCKEARERRFLTWKEYSLGLLKMHEIAGAKG